MPLLQTSAVLLLEVIEDFMGQWLKGGVDVVLPNAVLSFDNPVQFIYILETSLVPCNIYPQAEHG